jgi:hypothetical protein
MDFSLCPSSGCWAWRIGEGSANDICDWGAGFFWAVGFTRLELAPLLSWLRDIPLLLLLFFLLV